MKKLLLFLIMSLAVVLTGYAAEKDFQLTVGSGTVKGGTTNLTGLSNNASLDGKSFSDGVITITFSKGSGQNPVYNASNIRFYTGNTITISRKDGNLSTVDFAATQGQLNTYCTASNGSLAGNQWRNGAVSSVVITGKTQYRFNKITVKYDDNTGSDTKKDPQLYFTDYSSYEGSMPVEISSLTKDVTDSPVYLYVTSKISNFPTDATFTYSSSNTSVATVDNDGTINLVGAGNTLITATYAGNDEYTAGSAKCNLTVTSSTPQKCATPVLTPAPGTYNVGQKVVITCATPGATISYMIGEDIDDVTSGFEYTFTTAGSYDVLVYANANGYEESESVMGTYEIVTPVPVKPADPVFNPASGSYAHGTKITISSEGATKIAYQFEGQTSPTVVEGDNTSFTLEKDVVVRAQALNDAGKTATVEATYTVKKVAPVVSFSVPEGKVNGESVDVKIQLNEDVYPAADVYYTIDGKRAHIEHKENCEHRYTLGDVIKVNKPETGNSVTINVHAVNEAGYHTHAATYTFGSGNTSSAAVWKLVTDASTLKDGDQIVLVSNYTYSNKDWSRIAVNQAATSGAGKKTKITKDIKIVNDEISASDVDAIDNVLKFTLEKSGSYFKFKTGDSEYLNSADGSNGIFVGAPESNFTDISITIGTSGDELNKATMFFKNGSTNKNQIAFFYYKNGSVIDPILNSYNKSKTIGGQYDFPMIYRLEGGSAVAHDYYLVLEENMWDGGAETVVPFNYSETEGYTLDVATIASSTKDKPGFAGVFYVRDGKANHAGHYFVPAQAAAAPARANALSDGNVSFIPDEIGFVSVGLKLIDNSANPLTPGTPVYAVSSKLSTQYEEGKYLSINQGTLKLTADGDNSKLQIGEATVTGIESVVADADADAEVEYYNLQGVRVINPENGLYIRRQGNTATKVYIK